MIHCQRKKASLLIRYPGLFRVLTGFRTAASSPTGAGLLFPHVKKKSPASDKYQQEKKLSILQDA
ncbi:MAG: hypothetical protein AUJ60_06435 [Nitrospirae bacterium CG1_02_44_142]|nr:MAG: hypothetical protein AUJ60_06435 [Nitrospirae bacterium CG1_02_44_142]